MKDRILTLFRNDKSANFITEFFKEESNEARSVSGENSDWMSRFDIAKLCNWNMAIPAEKKLLDEMLQTLESNDEWDESKPFEVFMKAKGELRYFFAKKMISRNEQIDSKVGREIGKLNKTGKIALGDGEPSSSGPKIEMADSDKLEAKRLVLLMNDGNKKVSSFMAQLKTVKARISVINSADRHWIATHSTNKNNLLYYSYHHYCY